MGESFANGCPDDCSKQRRSTSDVDFCKPLSRILCVPISAPEPLHLIFPGLFFFEGQQTVDAGDSSYKSAQVGQAKTFRYLHCGDFRACPEHVLHPEVKGKAIDHVYLDTTYLDPKASLFYWMAVPNS